MLQRPRKIYLLSILALALGLLSGCMTEEKITPAYPVEKLEDQLSDLAFNIPIDRVQVQDEFRNVGNVRHIGNAFRRFAEMLADVNIDRGQTGTLDLDPLDYQFYELDDVDFKFVKNILLQNVHLVMDEREKETNANFGFIKFLEIYVKFQDEIEKLPAGQTVPMPHPRQVVHRTGANGGLDTNVDYNVEKEDIPATKLPERYRGGLLALSYQKDIDGLSCGGKCFDLKVHDIDWKARLKKNRRFSVMVRVGLDHAPKFSFSFLGFISVKVGLDLGGI